MAAAEHDVADHFGNSHGWLGSLGSQAARHREAISCLSNRSTAAGVTIVPWRVTVNARVHAVQVLSRKWSSSGHQRESTHLRRRERRSPVVDGSLAVGRRRLHSSRRTTSRTIHSSCSGLSVTRREFPSRSSGRVSCLSSSNLSGSPAVAGDDHLVALAGAAARVDRDKRIAVGRLCRRGRRAARPASACPSSDGCLTVEVAVPDDFGVEHWVYCRLQLTVGLVCPRMCKSSISEQRRSRVNVSGVVTPSPVGVAIENER